MQLFSPPGSRRSPHQGLVIVLMMLLPNAIPCQIPDATFDYRANSEPTFGYLLGGKTKNDPPPPLSVPAASYPEFGRRLTYHVDDKATMALCEFPQEQYPTTLAYNILPWLHYESEPAKHDVAVLDEMAFLHTADPASLVGAPAAGSIELHWRADRRFADEHRFGEVVKLPITSYIVMGGVGTADQEPAHYAVLDSVSTLEWFHPQVETGITHWYKIASVYQPGWYLPYSAPLRVTYLPPAAPDTLLWMEDVSFVRPDSVTILVTVSLYARHPGTEPIDIVAQVKTPTQTPPASPALSMLLDGTPTGTEGVWHYTGTIRDRNALSAGAYCGYAARIRDSAGTHEYPGVAGSYYTSNPNNRIQMRGHRMYSGDLTSPTYRRAWLAQSDHLFALASRCGGGQQYAGIFGDTAEDGWWDYDKNVFPYRIGGAEFSQAAYGASMAGFLQHIQGEPPVAGRTFIVNGANGTARAALAGLSDRGVLCEDYLASRQAYDGVTRVVTGQDWCTQINGIRAAISEPLDKVLVLPKFDGASIRDRIYLLASYLYVREPGHTYLGRHAPRPWPKDKHFEYYPEWQINLGAALAQSACPTCDVLPADSTSYDLPSIYATCPEPVWRDFARGTVIVNWCPKVPASDRLVTIPAGKHILQIDTATFLEGGRVWSTAVASDSAVTLGGGYALILLDEPLASPAVESAALRPLTGDASAQHVLAVRARAWDGGPLWVEAKTDPLGLPGTVVLRDDGIAPDQAAGDGIYSGAPASVPIPAGSYEVPIYARGDDGLSVHARVGVQVIPNLAVYYDEASGGTGALRYLQGTPVAAIPFSLGEDGPGSLDDPDLMIATSGARAQLFYREGAPGGVPEFEPYSFPDGQQPLLDHRALAAADLDNDGYSDLVLTHADELRVYLNSGGILLDRTSTLLTGQMAYAASVAITDYDDDGFLDIFVSRDSPEEPPPPPEEPVYPVYADGCASGFLFRNLEGKSLARTHPSHLGLMNGACTGSRSVLWGDVDGDGDQDLFIASYRDGGNRLYSNGLKPGQEGFTEATSGWLSGIGMGARITGAAWIDLDGDQLPDLAVSRSQIPPLQLFRNTGAGFEPVHQAAIAAALPDSSYAGLNVLDFDGNGQQDLLLLPSRAGAPVRLLARYPESGPGAGPAIVDVGPLSGIASGQALGAVVQDYDGDGLPDLYLCRPDEFYYRQKSRYGQAAPRWIAVRLEGCGVTSYDGVGATVAVAAAGERMTRWVSGGGSGRSSQPSPALYFGLGQSGAPPDSLTVVWPDGRTQVILDPPLDALTVVQDDRDPTIPARSVQMEARLGPGLTDWIFEWNTTEMSVAGQDTVWILDESCECDAQGMALTATTPGVVHEITPNGALYHHTLTWTHHCCLPGCSVTYKVGSATRFKSQTHTRTTTLPTCLSE